MSSTEKPSVEKDLLNEKSDLSQQLTAREAELTILNSIQAALAGNEDLDAIFEMVGEQISELFPGKAIALFTYDAETDLAHPRFLLEEGAQIESPPVTPGPIGRHLQASKKSLMVSTASEFDDLKAHVLEGTQPSLSGVYAPMIVNGEMVGTIHVESIEQEHAFTDSDLDFLTTLANSLSLALENARLLDEVQRSNQDLTEALRHQSAVSGILRVMATLPTEPDPVLHAVAEQARELCQADDVQVYQVAGAELLQVAHAGPLPGLERGEALPLVPGLITGRAVLEQRTIHTHDAAQISAEEYPVSAELQTRLKHRSVIVTPMIRDEVAVGAIVARRNQVRPFSDKQIDLLATLADQAAIAIENVRLFNETKRLLGESEQRAQELGIINSVQTALAAKLDMQAIYQAVGEQLRSIFGSQVVGIVSSDREKRVRRWHYIYEKGVQLDYLEAPFNSLYDDVVQSLDTDGKFLRNGTFPQYAAQFPDYQVPAGEMPRSLLAVVIPRADQSSVIDHISLQDVDGERLFTESDVRLLGTLAGSMGAALENARLFDETQRLLNQSEERAAELQIISSVQQALATKLAIQEIYDAVGEKLHEVFPDAQVVDILHYDLETQLLHPRFVLERGKRYHVDPWKARGFRKHVVDTGRPLVINHDMDRLAKEYDNDWVVLGERAKSFVAVPMLISGKAIGVISLQHIDREDAFSPSDVSLLETLASSMGVALENARLFNETQRLLKESEQRAAELQIINSVQQGLASKLDIQAIYDLVGDRLGRTFDADTAFIAFLNENRDQLLFPYYKDRSERAEDLSRPYEDDGVFAELVRRRRPLMFNTPEEYYALLAEADVPAIPSPGSEQDLNQSNILAPIFRDQEVVGAVSVQSYQRHAFTQNDLTLLETLTSSMSAALENARLFDETQRLLKETEQRAAELQIVNSVQRGLASQLDLEAIYTMIGDRLREIFQADTTYIVLHDEEKKAIFSAYYADRDRRLGPSKRPYRQGLAETIIESGKPLLFDSTEEWNAAGAVHVPSPGSDKDLNQSYLGVPIFQDDKVIGAASVQSYEMYAFDENDQTLLQTLTNSMSVALQNARLFDETQRLLKESDQRAAELQIINSVQQGLASKLDIQAIYELLGDKIREIFRADTTFIAFHDKERNVIQVPYYNDRGERQIGWERPYGAGGAYETMVESGGPLLLNSLQEMEEAVVYSVPSPGSEEDLNQSLLLVPIIIDGEIVGATSVQSYQRSAFSQNDLTLLETLNNSMSVALENARLFAETEQRASELATINTVGQALVSEAELDALIQLIGNQIRETFDADIAYVALLNHESQTIHFPYSHGERFDSLPLGEGLTSKIIESGDPLLINRDIDQRRDELGVTQVGRRASSYLGVPIRMGNEVFGVLSAQSIREEGRFDERDLALLNTIAANVGVAIRNAQLFEEIKRQKQYYQAVIENSPAAIVLMDMQATVTGWNPAAERLFGYSREEALGKNIDKLVARDEELFQEAVAYSEQAMRDQEVSKLTKRTRKDGSFVEVDLAGVPVSVDGEYVGFIAIYHDVTELQQARMEAEQANRAKSTFLANMSHELRTPLNAIIGFTRIVRRKGEGSLPEKQVENLDKVLVSADHLLNLINTVLDISKIEAGRMEVNAAEFQLPPLIQQVADTAQPLIAEQVEFRAQLPADLPSLHTDREKLKQILINLLSNAAKFTSRGEIELSVAHEWDLLQIDVRDTGIGISEGDLQRIFEEFQQADSSPTRQYGGTGLGLAISRSLARLLGGELTAASQVSKGSTFSLTIPLRYGPQVRLEEADLRSLTESQAAGEALIVLAIDDDPNVHDLLRENLSDAGYQVVSASTGEQGLRLARELHPFAITLDIMMPHKDGWQVLHDLKAEPATRDIPVIMLTIVDKQSLGYQLGAADYLVKPLEEDAVVSALRRLRWPGLVEEPSRILVVDDDPNIAEMVRQLLEGEPYQIEAATDGAQALQSIRRQPPAVMLLDLIMPGMDGFALLAALKAEGAAFPIIVLTAKSLTQRDLDMLEGQVARVIEKNGIDQDRLLAELSRSIGELDGGRPTPGAKRAGE